MFLQEDRKDAAEIHQIRANTIATYVKEGFTAASAVDAVVSEDETLLKHTGLVSVQLQEPGSTKLPEPGQLAPGDLPVGGDAKAQEGNGKAPASLPPGGK
jgi:hypothetical protein